MTVISKGFAGELVADKEMRNAYLAAQTRTKIANQIRTIREQRGWSQADFAKFIGKPQSNVSRIENREYGSFTLTTLLEVARALEVGLVVEFVTYEEFLGRTHDLSPGKLQVSPFSAAAITSLSGEQDIVVEENAITPQLDMPGLETSRQGSIAESKSPITDSESNQHFGRSGLQIINSIAQSNNFIRPVRTAKLNHDDSSFKLFDVRSQNLGVVF